MDQVIERVCAPSGEEIAWARVGEGPVLVLAAWWTSHLELDWQDPELRGFIEALAQHRTVVRYDRPGVGLSDRSDRPFDIDAETSYLRAVVDATGADRVDLLGISCGGPSTLRLTAEEPDLVDRVVLFGSYLSGHEIADPPTRQALVDLVRASWGIGSQTLTGMFLPDAHPAATRRFSRSQRETTTADVAADLLDLTFTLDAAPWADQVDRPVLVLHRAHDRVIGADHGRALAERVPGATYTELEGREHIPWTGECGPALAAITSFLADAPSAPPATRELATICLLDVVGSTEILSAIGDDRWRSRLDQLATMAAEEAEIRGGQVLKDTGDGALVRFALPGAAVDFARAMGSRGRSIDVPLRAGVHTGEVERRGDDVTGVAVVAASRVCDLAEAGQVLVTRTVADLVAGSGLGLVDQGTHELKGLAGTWPLLAVAGRGEGDRARPEVAPEVDGEGTDGVGTDGGGVVRFTDCELDVAAYELRRGGELVAVEPQVFEVLAYLVAHRDGVVTKEQLLDEVWGDRFVSESALTSRIRSARKAVGDDGKAQAVIRTVHGRGYRFVADLA